jgi:hypothetical protein
MFLKPMEEMCHRMKVMLYASGRIILKKIHRPLVGTKGRLYSMNNKRLLKFYEKEILQERG